jgi:hypothetical protein
LTEFIEVLEAEVAPAALSSEWTFDRSTGDLMLNLSDKDVELLRPRFTSGGVTKIEVAVYAMQPGSNTAGPLVDVTTLPTAEFEIEVLGQTEFDTCSTNRLVKTDLTIDQQNRPSTFEYRIAQAGETQDALTVGGLNVHTDIAESTCVLSRSISVYDPTWTSSAGTVAGRWIEVRDSDFLTVDDSAFNFVIDASQTNYLDTIVPMFIAGYEVDVSDVPDSITIEFKFSTRDPTSATIIEDFVTVTIISNGDHGQCVDATYNIDETAQDLSGLEFVVPLDDALTTKTVTFTPVTSDIEGCAGLLKTVI